MTFFKPRLQQIDLKFSELYRSLGDSTTGFRLNYRCCLNCSCWGQCIWLRPRRHRFKAVFNCKPQLSWKQSTSPVVFQTNPWKFNKKLLKAERNLLLHRQLPPTLFYDWSVWLYPPTGPTTERADRVWIKAPQQRLVWETVKHLNIKYFLVDTQRNLWIHEKSISGLRLNPLILWKTNATIVQTYVLFFVLSNGKFMACVKFCSEMNDSIQITVTGKKGLLP